MSEYVTITGPKAHVHRMPCRAVFGREGRGFRVSLSFGHSWSQSKYFGWSTFRRRATWREFFDEMTDLIATWERSRAKGEP